MVFPSGVSTRKSNKDKKFDFAEPLVIHDISCVEKWVFSRLFEIGTTKKPKGGHVMQT